MKTLYQKTCLSCIIVTIIYFYDFREEARESQRERAEAKREEERQREEHERLRIKKHATYSPHFLCSFKYDNQKQRQVQ